MNFTIDSTTITLAILLLTVLILMGIVFHLHSRLKKFLVGHKAENLHQSIASIDGSLVELKNFKAELESYLLTVEKRLKKSTQAIYTVRFNPFQGTTGSGGNQSFATAFLNEHGDGVVVSSLYAREHISIFSKPVKNGKSEYELSDEEKEAIEGALKNLK
jgi:hypothetical protein